MEKSNEKPTSIKAFEILGGMFNTQVIAALTQANIFEIIGNDSKSIDEIASVSKVNKNVLSRSLRYAALINVVNFIDGKYALTDILMLRRG